MISPIINDINNIISKTGSVDYYHCFSVMLMKCCFNHSFQLIIFNDSFIMYKLLHTYKEALLFIFIYIKSNLTALSNKTYL